MLERYKYIINLTNIYIHAYIYTYMHTYIHTYIHTCIQVIIIIIIIIVIASSFLYRPGYGLTPLTTSLKWLPNHVMINWISSLQVELSKTLSFTLLKCLKPSHLINSLQRLSAMSDCCLYTMILYQLLMVVLMIRAVEVVEVEVATPW
jgi:hypothetical protein